MLTPDDFEEEARRVFESIPRRFRERVDGPHVELAPKPSEHVPGSYVLGECLHHPDWTGESPLQSSVILYHGSFLALERRDPSFDVLHEIRETVLHEVQHHLEDAAGEDRLADLDWAADQNDRRAQGLPHDDLFWRAGVPLEEGLYRIGNDLFLELELRESEWREAGDRGLEVTVGGALVRLEADDFRAGGPAAAVFDWDWTEAPRELREADPYGHDHGPVEGWGDLVVVARRQRGILPALLGRRSGA